MWPGLAFMIAVILALLVWPASRICTRVGFSPWLGALIIVPGANVVLLWFVALARWPALDASEGGG
jgi:predicted PurR-regulated permease PerM